MTISAADLTDLVNTTKAEFGPPEWTDLTDDVQEYVAFSKLMKEERVQYDSGKHLEFRTFMDDNNSAAWVGMHATDNYTITDSSVVGTVQWRHSNWNWGYEYREQLMNRGESRIVDLIKARRKLGQLSWAQLFETDFWSKPSDSTDELKPFGVTYWIVANSSTGFNGGNPSGFSSGAAGISSTTYPRWANHTAQYTTISPTDMVQKMRRSARKTNFRPPIDLPLNQRGSDRYGYYTNIDVIEGLEALAENQNENLGNDVASKDGLVSFHKIPITYVPQLDGDAQDTLYGINWSTFYICYLKGDYNRESDVHPHPTKHNTYVADVDNSCNIMCVNRRKNWRVNIA